MSINKLTDPNRKTKSKPQRIKLEIIKTRAQERNHRLRGGIKFALKTAQRIYIDINFSVWHKLVDCTIFVATAASGSHI